MLLYMSHMCYQKRSQKIQWKDFYKMSGATSYYITEADEIQRDLSACSPMKNEIS